MSLRNSEFSNSNGNIRLTPLGSKNIRTKNNNNEDILFPKRPNKRYEKFISKEKQKYDLNWENRLKDQNLTDQNYFLNYYSYERGQKNESISVDFSTKVSKETKNQLVVPTSKKNVHHSLSSSLPSPNFQLNKKTFTVITGKSRNEKPLYQIGSPSLIRSIQTPNKQQKSNEDLQDDDDNALTMYELMDEVDSEKIDKEFDNLNQSFKSKTLNFSTPKKKINQSPFSKTANFIPQSKKMSPLIKLSSNENTNSLSHFINIDNTTQFAPFPKRQAKTSHRERKATSNLGNSLPDIRIPTRKEIEKLKLQNQAQLITSQSTQNEKFPTISIASKMPCTVLSNTITTFDLI